MHCAVLVFEWLVRSSRAAGGTRGGTGSTGLSQVCFERRSKTSFQISCGMIMAGPKGVRASPPFHTQKDCRKCALWSQMRLTAAEERAARLERDTRESSTRLERQVATAKSLMTCLCLHCDPLDKAIKRVPTRCCQHAIGIDRVLLVLHGLLAGSNALQG